MLIIVKDFKWTQTDDEICIRVPFKKNSSHEVDIVTHENFIKIHASPFYFEAFLLHPIIEGESRCQLMSDEAKFTLKKAQPLEWEKLERDFKDKQEKLETKNEILERIQQREGERVREKLALKEKIKRSEVENSMAKDAEIRSQIESMQKLAVERAMSEQVKVTKKVIPQKSSPPAVRKSGTIEVKFSKRNFPTPKRESQDPAEQEWLCKQAEARKAIGFVPDDLRAEERDPMYLKQKGDEFFHQKNFLAAISAYSTGIKIAANCYELHLNRSAAQFAQGNYQRCAEDCSRALELLNPPVASNLKARTQAMARRGAALSKLGFLKQAYDEFVAAVKLDPTDEMLRNDAEMLRAKLEAASESDDD